MSLPAGCLPAGCLPPGWHLAHTAETASTNADLVAAALAGAAEGTALLAARQTAGRGREGRVWHSPSGNLHLSVLLRPDCAAGQAGQIGLIAALAVAETLAPLLPAGARLALKWPNDVLAAPAGGAAAKLAGVLVETGLAGARIGWAVVGIGVNLAHHPDDAARPATSLPALGAAPAAPEAVAPALLGRFAARLAVWRAEGFAPARAAWQARGPEVGEPASVRIGATLLSGRFRALDPLGRLVLEDAGGGLRTLAAGELLPTPAP